MQAEPHFDTVVRHSLVELLVVFVFNELPRLAEGGHNFEEGHGRHVRQLVHRVHTLKRNRVLCYISFERFFGELPNQQKGIADVLVRCA